MGLIQRECPTLPGAADGATRCNQVTVADFKLLASSAPSLIDQAVPDALIKEALLIRTVEQKFLTLFSTGQMNGTVHTCVGQEFSAVAVAGQLDPTDWVTSNHRCHGHFISRTKNWRGLIDELMGLDSGVCRGIGSSQHLFAPGFLSNGPQGALIPVATGIALHHKRNGLPGISVSFIGEGTLGEGVLYESMNMAKLLQLPHLIVCENNLYSQSTPQSMGVAGDIPMRARAFGLTVYEADTWNVGDLLATARSAVDHVRRESAPAFLIIRTYRLNAHSKGDDDRDSAEINFFREHDPLSRILTDLRWAKINQKVIAEVDAHVANSSRSSLPLEEYLRDQLPRTKSPGLLPIKNHKIRMAQALNHAYRKRLEAGAAHIGEDIHDPYGGAFKVTKGLMVDFPNSVFTTPISEAAIVGVATGMSLMGTESYAEIMFGDFMTNVFDQLISNLSKIHHMYAFQATVPVRIRTPMGGKRGYGPTHSQSLEKFLVGIDNVATIYLNSLHDPAITVSEVSAFPGPVVLLENKVDYGNFLWECPPHLEAWREDRPAGSLRITPTVGKPTVTIVSYGQTARDIADHLEDFFVATDMIPELVVLQMLHPLDISLAESSIASTGRLVLVEDGSVNFGIGAEILAQLAEHGTSPEKVLRIGAEAVPIPSVSSLELQVLPTMGRILHQVHCSNMQTSR
jgi:2-oxoisovalerate dehydrogenase E1 component